MSFSFACSFRSSFGSGLRQYVEKRREFISLVMHNGITMDGNDDGDDDWQENDLPIDICVTLFLPLVFFE